VTAEYRFVTNCIGSDSESIRDLVDSEKDITLRTFRQHIGLDQWKELLENFGYDRHLPISKDWHVGFYKGVYRGKPAVFLRHSAIEWIFVKDASGGPVAGGTRSGAWWGGRR
jgi:hypothetical protein